MNEAAAYTNLVEDEIEEDEVAGLSSQAQPPSISFKPLPTTTLNTFATFIMISVVPLCFVLPNVVENHPNKEFILVVANINFSATSIIIYINVGVWLLSFILCGILKLIHSRHKLYGYVSLHKKLNVLKHVPFLAFSTGNVALLLYTLWVLNTTNLFDVEDDKLKYIILQVIVCTQCAVAITSQLIYLYILIRFNISRVPPDLYNEMLLSTTPMLYSSNLSNILTIRSHKQQQQAYLSLCETQSDIIEYLKHRCIVLESKINELGQQRDRINSHV